MSRIVSIEDRALKVSLAVTIERLVRELAQWDDDLGQLHADIPGDPGVTAWPKYLEQIVEIAEESRALCARHLALCQRVIRDWDVLDTPREGNQS